MNELHRYRKGSVTRRHFLGVTGLGLAAAVLGQAMPWLRPRDAYGAISGKVSLCTWPNYHNQANLDQFTKDTGVPIQVTIFGSNEEMLAKLQAGGTGWDVFVPTNYTISTYVKLGLIDPLDTGQTAQFRCQRPRFPVHECRHRRRQDLCGAEGLGYDRLRHQHEIGQAQSSGPGKSSGTRRGPTTRAR